MVQCTICGKAPRSLSAERQFRNAIERIGNTEKERMMSNVPDKMTAIAQANMEALQSLTKTAYAAAERLATLNADTAKAALEESLASAKALFEVKDLSGLTNAQAMAQPAIDRTTAYWRSVYEIWRDAQAEMTKVLGAEMSEINKATATALEGTPFANPGANAMLAAVNSAMSASQAAMERMSKAAEQMAEMTQSNIAAATGAAIKAAAPVLGSATKSTKK
jgi:phasin family protein